LTELDVSANKIQGWPRLPEGGKGLTKLVLSGNAIPEVIIAFFRNKLLCLALPLPSFS